MQMPMIERHWWTSVSPAFYFFLIDLIPLFNNSYTDIDLNCLSRVLILSDKHEDSVALDVIIPFDANSTTEGLLHRWLEI